jgi:5-oxoprolinase (ATP-hydrolysing)
VTHDAHASAPTDDAADLRWRFWIDRGGTFTDLVAVRPDGSSVTHKLLSDDPLHSEDATLLGIRRLMGLPPGAPIPGAAIAEVRMGTTVGTNALLERRGEPTALAVTRGFADALRIGYQDRPDIFALRIELPELLHERVIEIDERLRADGTVERPLDEEAARAAFAAARAAGLRSIAIALMHGYRHPRHEQRLAEIARDVGFTQVSPSSETIPLVKLVGRGETTVVDAYLSPILRRYVDTIAAELGVKADDGATAGGGAPSSRGTPAEADLRATAGATGAAAAPSHAPRLFFMQSHGGLTDARGFRGKDSILSGPAGGIVGAVETCRAAGYDRIVTFDMGGTSTDVAHYAGSYERSLESTVAGVRLRSPMLRIHTVAAGGGSICSFTDGRYRVGPRSAGADPGPACYRRGGPLTVTDCNVVVGKIRPEHFPHVFGVGGDQTIDPAASRARLEDVAAAMRAEGVEPGPPEQLADDLIRVAVDGMARAIKQISTHRGYDVSDYTLCCFGAAGGQHACLVAEDLGIRSIILHPLAGVLSAYGMGLASVRALRQQSVERPLEPQAAPDLTCLLHDLAQAAADELAAQGSQPDRISTERRLLLKYEGTDMTLPITWRSIAEMADEFNATHRERYGFTMDEARLVVDAVQIEAIDRGDAAQLPVGARDAVQTPADPAASPVVHPAVPAASPVVHPAVPAAESSTVAIYTAGRRREAPVLARDGLAAGDTIDGPAIIFEPTSTTVVEPGWSAEVRRGGELLLRRHARVAPKAATARTSIPASSTEASAGRTCSPLLLEVFNNLFMSCAEQMGAMLQNTARSVNVKERLDFSCAIFDEHGLLIANAPHLPVHLGSMGETVRAVLRSHGGRLRSGDAVLVNSPYHGGTHLPDLTVVSPVSIDERPAEPSRTTTDDDRPLASERPLFYLAARAHHADVGGSTPGSMPPDSSTIEDEGVLISDFLLVEDGRFREAELVALLSGGAYPARNVPQNVADLKAQVAANARGGAELRRMVARHGADVVRAYVGFMYEHAEDSVRRALRELAGGSFECRLDDGDRVAVRVDIDRTRGTARIDFSGTSPQRPDNFNAPRAVTIAAVLYVVRTLVDVEIPLNEGCLAPLEIVIPDGCLLAAAHPAAVAAGNVEISQIVTDTLLGAFGVLAGSQGTMNNLTFGNGRHQYYETICGGVGAGRDFDGCSAVHSHMTNSRLTDPEVLESRHPVVVDEFAVRRGSGGDGRRRGGDGARRRLRFLEPMTAAIVSGRRTVAPHGLDGGRPGLCGRNAVVRAGAAATEAGRVEDRGVARGVAPETDERREEVGGVARLELRAGDAVVIETPGGGGFGAPPDAPGTRV